MAYELGEVSCHPRSCLIDLNQGFVEDIGTHFTTMIFLPGPVFFAVENNLEVSWKFDKVTPMTGDEKDFL